MDTAQAFAEEAFEKAKKNKKAETGRGFAFTRADLLEPKPPVWLIEGIFEKNTMSCVFGESGAGKSFWALCAGTAIATGTPFFGHVVKEPGAVFYIVGEGHGAFPRRLAVWQTHTGISLAEKPLYISNRAALFLNAESAEKVADAIAEIADQTGVKPDFIIIDTLARNYGGDENSTEDMTAFVDAIDEVRRPYGASALIVHHTGLADKTRSRGNGSLKAAMDHEYQLTKHDAGGIEMTCRKAKDGPDGWKKHFELLPVQVGDISSAVLIEADADAPRSIIKERKLVGRKKRAIAVLRNVLIDKGETKHIRQGMPAVMCIETGQFREALRLANIVDSDNPDNIRRGISKVIEDLNDSGITGTWDKYIWLPDKPDKTGRTTD